METKHSQDYRTVQWSGGSKGWAVMLVVENEKDKVEEARDQIIDRIYCFIVEPANLFY